MDNRVGSITAHDLQNLLIVVEEEVAGISLGGQRRHKLAYVFLMGHWGKTENPNIVRWPSFNLLRIAVMRALQQQWQRGEDATRAAARALLCVCYV